MGDIILTDEQIERLLGTPKTAISSNARWKTQRGSRQRNYDLKSQDGKLLFSLYLRQNERLKESFSCGLLYLHAGGEKVTLARYNGSDHPHYNPLDGTRSDNHCTFIERPSDTWLLVGSQSTLPRVQIAIQILMAH